MFIRLLQKMLQPFKQLFFARVIKTKIQVSAFFVFVLVDKIIQQNMQPLNIRKIPVTDDCRIFRAEIVPERVGNKAENPEGRAGTGGKLISFHIWKIRLVAQKPFL